MHHHQFPLRSLLLLLCLCLVQAVKAQWTPDALPGKAPAAKVSKPLESFVVVDVETYSQYDDAPMELTLENLLIVLEKEGVLFKEIVASQALLETGNFKSRLCVNAHNLFGLRHARDGSYFTFNTWEESVVCYRDAVQYKYKGGDYYAFLRRIGYAENPHYTARVREIQRQHFGVD